ncbi:hypothetical protein Peur_011534 [Populus x canadensis]
MVAPSNSLLEDNTWLADSGANRHITNDISDIAFPTPYYVKDVVNESETLQLEAEDTRGTLRKWKIKVGKSLFALKTTIDDDMLEHIRDAKKSWDTFTKLFSKKNDTKL